MLSTDTTRRATDAPGYRRQLRLVTPLPEDALARPARRSNDVCGRDYDHTLDFVQDVHGGGTEAVCLECGAQVVIEPDGTLVPLGEPMEGGW